MLVIFHENEQKVAYDSQSKISVEPRTGGKGSRLMVDGVYRFVDEDFDTVVKAINDARKTTKK